MPKDPSTRVNAGSDDAQNWISGSHLQHFIAQGRSAGLDIRHWLQQAGLTEAGIGDANRMIPLAVVEKLLAALPQHDIDRPIGLELAGKIQPATLGPLGQIAEVCPDFGSVLKAVEKLHGLLSNIGQLSITQDPGRTQISWECKPAGEELRRYAREYVLGSFVVIFRFLLPDQSHPLLRVNFSHDPPQDPARTRDYFDFFQAPVHFKQPRSSLILPSSLLKQSLRHGNAPVREVLEQHANQLLDARNQTNALPDEVRRLIRAMLIDGPPTRDMVADQLGLSSRHLQRRLKDAGHSYRELLDQVRMQLAKDLLSTSAASAEEIAERLGFAARQAFLRWFRQHAEQTPSEFRQQK